MKNRKIYNKTLCFIWPRIPHAVVGVFAAVGLPALILLLLNTAGIYPGGAFAAVLIIICVFAAKQLGGLGTKRADVAQTAMMTRAIVYGNLPENVKKEGYRVARYHFDSITTGDIVKQIIGKIKENRKSETKDFGSLWNELRSFIFVLAAGLIPFCGECTLAWQFAYPGRTLDESFCDSVETIGNSWLRMLLFSLYALVALLASGFIFALVATCAVMLLQGKFAPLDRVFDFIYRLSYGMGDYKKYGDNVVCAFFGLLTIGMFIPFVRSSLRLQALRTFFRCADRKPPTGKLYMKYGEAVKKLRRTEKKDD